MSDIKKLEEFFAQEKDGKSNLDLVRENQKILMRLPETDKGKSVEAVGPGEAGSGDAPGCGANGDEGCGLPGVVIKDGRIRGFGIDILNEDVYPLQYFRIYLRSIGLFGRLDLSGFSDMVFLDLYHNRIEAVETAGLDSMRIFGVQDNWIEDLDCSGMPVVQGIDAGMNRLEKIDVSKNPELVELYINDNRISEVDLGSNRKLKYFYCHNNNIERLDTRQNPLIRHLNATGNPMKEILCFAPQRDEKLPLEITSEGGGSVGLRFNPIYDAQWKETGKWQQAYYAYPDAGMKFAGWYDESGVLFSDQPEYEDEYGASRKLTARFE